MKNNLLQPDSAKKNFAFQFMYQIVILVIPLIVSPYLTRTMGGKSLGVYSYTYSIAYYFVVFAMLGINRHGQRIISQRRSNNIELRKTFWSLFAVHIFTSFLALVAYVFYLFFICDSDINVAWAQTIYVAAAAFDLTWLFYGLEKFKTVTIRNAAIKIINTICIFAFVRSPSDVVLYTIIMAMTECLGQVVLFPQVIAQIPPIKFSASDIKEHIKPLFTLFVAIIAATLYTVFDKTLLGIMATKESVAFYEYSDKIVKIPKTFISIICTVLFPRSCQYAQAKDYKGMHSNLEMSLMVTSLIGFAASFGLLAIADQFAILYYGDEFAVCGSILSAMCPLILIIGIGDAVRSIYIYPLKMDMTMVKILFLNAGVNLTLSALLIPAIGVNGAIIGSIAAESTGLITELFIVRRYVSVFEVISQCFPYAVIGGVMFIAVKIVGAIAGFGWLSLGIQVLSGTIIYCAGVLLYLYLFKRKTLYVIYVNCKSKLDTL